MIGKDRMNDYKEIVLEHIPNEPCQKHHKQIADEVGLTPYDTRLIIRELRNSGFPICSDSVKGYWMARTSGEIQDVINMFNGYIGSMLQTVEALQDVKEEYLAEGR